MKYVLASLLLLLVTACTTPVINEDIPPTPKHWHEKHDLAKVESDKVWWQEIKDPILAMLIEDALRSNPDIKQAAARISETRGLEKSSFANLFPKLDATTSADYARTTYTKPVKGSDYTAHFDASYELDLFGKNTKAYEASDYALQATEQDYEWTKLSLIAEVARVYILMRTQEQHITVALKNLNIQKSTLDLVRKRNDAGAGSNFDVERAAKQVYQSESIIEEYKRARGVYFHSLVMLTGLHADELHNWLKVESTLPALPLKPFIDSPSNVLANRPDIAAANLRFSQATALKEAQAAAIFPSISLSGMFGFSKTLIANSTNVWNLAAAATMPALDFGRIQGKIDAASQVEVQAYEAWRKAILVGVQDVEIALNNIIRVHNQRASLNQAQAHAKNAFQLAQIRYKEGDISFLDVLDAESQLNNAENSLVEAEGNYLISVIALYKAIGQY